MAAFDQIEQHFINQYSTNVLYLAQQEGSRLRGTVMNETVSSEEYFWDQFGSRDPAENAVRYQDSPIQEQARESRRVALRRFNDGDFIDTFDAVKTLNDPSSPLVRQMGLGFGRQMDKVIVEALGGTAYTGRKTLTSVALPSAQKVAKDSHKFSSGSGDADLTVSKLIEARDILGMADVDAPTYHLVTTRRQISALLTETGITSNEYNQIKALVNGEVDYFMGFTFHEVSPSILTKTATERMCYAYTPDAVGFALGQEPRAYIDRRSDKSFNWYAYMEMFIGATRLEEAKVVEIACTEAS